MALGYDGKWAIHPSQLDTLNATFSPTSEEVERARGIVAALQQAEADAGRGAVMLDGDNAGAFANRGTAFALMGDFARAIADYNSALKLRPNLPGIALNRGLAYAQGGEYGRAIPDFDSALVNDPRDAFALFNRGIAKKALGDSAGAEADIARAREIEPTIGK